MIFFIATILIAQLIILWNIVFFLITVDNKLNSLTLKVVSYNEIIPELMTTISEMVSDVTSMLPEISKEIIKKRNKFIINEIKTIVESVALFTFKPKYKKLLLGIRVGIRLIKKLIKKKNML